MNSTYRSCAPLS
uniref:Uncharacterized protein n=1 Tax=Anguilla anguilla TaxID=7936 RepID=A0A0E9UBB8_ANGAN